MKKLFANHYMIAFLSTLVISIGLLIGSFLLPPKGTIDPSTLKASAELFMWPTLAFGAKAIYECRKCRELMEKEEREKEEE